jgi:hypothetical protein
MKFSVRHATATALRLFIAAAALPVCGLPSGCVTMHRGDLYADDRDQVFVRYFTNDTFYRDVEFDLSEQLVQEILSSPGLRLSSKAEAEIVLSGRVVDVRQHVLSENPNQTPTSANTSITVEVLVEDARTGEVIRKQRVSQQGQFVPARGETVESARLEAYRFLARDIVRVLEEDF